MSPRLRLLAAHFFGRFFDNDIVSQECDMRTSVVESLGMVAVPGMFVAFYMLPQSLRFNKPFEHNWMLVTDYYFFVLYSMVVMGFVMVLQWDSLFPDRRDYLVFTPLPMGSASIFAGKFIALWVFLSVFVVGCNFLGGLLGPLVSAGAGNPNSVIWPLFWAHAVAVGSAGLFVALAFAAVQGLLINILTGRAFRRIGPWVQMACMCVLVTVLFLTPLACTGMRPIFESGDPILRWFPPYWFLALYMDLLPGQPGGPIFHEGAMLARQGLAWSAGLFAVFYLLGYRRHSRRVMDSLETAGHGPGWLRRRFDAVVNRHLLPHPLERASFHFINQTILRSARHRLFLAAVAGVAIAIVLPTLFRFTFGPQGYRPHFVSHSFIVIPLMLSFFVVSGLRAAFNLPVELRANWLFRVAESEQQVRHIRAARKWVVLMGVVPLFALLAPLEVWFRGWRAAAVYLSIALALSLLMLNLLMIWFRKIPFTCSYFPGKTSMAGGAAMYIAGFVAYVVAMGRLQARLLDSPTGLAIFFTLITAALVGLAWLERRELVVDSNMIYEDQPEPTVRSLELG